MDVSAPHVVHVVATTEFAGVERYVTYVAPGLIEAGWRVTVIGGDPTRMRAVLDPIGAAHLPYRSSYRTIATLRRLDPDLVHTHMTVAEFLAAAGTRRTAPIVTTRHFATRRGSTFAVRNLGRLLRRRLTLQVAISGFVAAAIGEPSEVIANGVPIAPRGEHDERTVLVCQRLESEKDTATAIEIWARSGLAEEGWTLQIAGDGSELDDLRALADDRGVGRSVEFLGFVDDPTDRMARSGLFLATATAEPFGLGVAEAMSTGSVVAATAGGAHPELLGEHGEGLMFAPGDADEGARLLREWCSRPLGERREAGEQLRQRQQDEYRLGHHVDRLSSTYRRLLAGLSG